MKESAGNGLNNRFDSDLDERMAKAIREERRKQKDRENRRKSKAAARKIALLLIVLAGAVCLCFGLVKLLSSDIFETEEEFIAFADDAFASESVCPESGVDDRDYRFSDETSVAVRRGDWVDGETKSFLDKQIDTISENNKDAKALLIETAAYTAENGAISAVIHYSTYVADGRHMKRAASHVDTYLFNPDTHRVADPLQVMNVNYKGKARDYADEYFSKTFSKKELSENWKDYTDSTDDNFNKFVVTSEQVTFFFDEGTVLPEGEGTPEMSIPHTIIGSAIRPEVLERYIDKKKPMVALTFDDGPYTKTETKILDVLERNGSVATFFYLGNRVKNDHESAVRAVKIGCEIGNHSWSHPVLSQLDNKQVTSQIKKTNAVIHKYCGVDPVIARPPYGEFNDRVLKKTGMAQVLWSLDTMDWKSRNPDAVFKAVKKDKNLDGKIILMHSIYDESAEATEMIIPWLKENGYQTVTVSELIKYRTGRTPKAGEVYKKLN